MYISFVITLHNPVSHLLYNQYEISVYSPDLESSRSYKHPDRKWWADVLLVKKSISLMRRVPEIKVSLAQKMV